MNEVHAFIQNFAGNLEDFQQINEFMKSQTHVMAANQSDTLRLIKNNTDAAKNSLIQLWLITSLYQNKSALHQFIDANDQIDLINNYFQNFVPLQVTTQNRKLYELATIFSELLISEKKAIYGINTLKNVIFKVRQNDEQVCGSLHKEFARLCIKAKCYQHSLIVIDHPVIQFKKNTSAMDILNYMYYKALIYTALKQFQNAIDCLKLVISFPCQLTHKIHLESYKKLILLNLLEKGQMPDIPKYTNVMLKHNLETSFACYRNLGSSYIGKDDKLFNEIIENNQEEFFKDKNYGLIKKLQKKYQRVRVKELSNTYLTLRYNLTDNKEIEDTLFEMINQDESQAKIDSQKEMISFIDSTSMTSASQQDDAKEAEYLTVIEELENQNQRIIKLMSNVQGLDKGLQLTKQFLQRNLNDRGGNSARDDSGGDMMM
ncbi:UNKNOWN [Stylonychia lemnae]|uniref:COP9 signalosome complex subunit 3 N-terminal helical repeats domain-containing protein n=1 Tax=Stylonychia lemnae TaxID=5949 RepID=A0A077ZMH4_STYLE|nr:UNKNOWN [Stylonychia lemnae]|eukprot:CDW71172.1 UNKNOWN [Stylonychia lemnae]